MATNTAASADAATYVLDTTADLQAAAAGAFADGQSAQAGTENYFTLYYSAKTKIDSSHKDFDDGYAGDQRVNFGGKADAAGTKNGISFKTSAAATVKVWWAQGGDDNRQVVITDMSGAEVTATTGTYTKNSPYMSTLEVPAAGTYFLGGKENNNYFFKVEVTEKAESAEYTLDTTADLQAAAAGAFADGQSAKAGTDGFFTLYYSTKTKIDSSHKDFDDGYAGDQRVNFGGKADAAATKNGISFTVPGAATVKVWWAQGGDDNRQVVITDMSGTEITATTGTYTKNSPYMSTLEIPSAGTYFLGGKENNNYFFKVVVTTGGGAAAPRADWSTVAAPVIASAVEDHTPGDNGVPTDNIKVTVNAAVGNNGGDSVRIVAVDETGKEVASQNSLAESNTHERNLPISKTGKYTVKAILSREGEADKESAPVTVDFTLSLKSTTISSVTNKGNGKVSVKWDPVDEATGYVIYAAGKEVKTSTNSGVVDGLKVGDKVEFTVAAVRGSETGKKSAGISATITAEEQQEWGFTAYGTSTSGTTNGVHKGRAEGNLNEGSVTVFAEGGNGKLNQAADDGISFYYTAVPSNKNFTFRAKIHVDTWTWSNGQEAFGVAAVDMLPEKSYDTSHWTNVYYTAVGRDGNGRQGVSAISKTGITPENWQAVKDNTFDRTKLYSPANQRLDTGIYKELGIDGSSRYNLVGNCTNPESIGHDTVGGFVDFDLEITKNNTGYFCSYYKDGKLVGTVKNWGTDELSVLDKDYVYVGVFAARNFTVSLKNTDYTLEIRDPSQDPAPEERPKEDIKPSISIESGNYTNSSTHDLILRAGYKGTATVKVDGTVVAENVVIGDKLDSDGNIIETIVPVAVKSGKNNIEVTYTVDASVDPGDAYRFSTRTATASTTVTYDTYFAEQNNIYVAPGATKGNGGKNSPIDLQTALNLARPGQKIILKEGTYKFKNTVLVPRDIDGTKDAMIYLIADPEAKTRPVLDFEGSTGIGLQIRGDYWYVQGFDVTHAGNNGLRVDGSYCVVDDVDAYRNYGTGISIQIDSKFSRALWPSYNLIKNCDAYYNADAGEEDADGFSAKFTVGVGNVFDNCVAYCNADDGWDLYGRNYPVEPVTIQNCVTYKNGYREDGSRGKGNGNGFKLGGDNNAAAHLLINSVSFMNGADGITCNSSPNVIVKNSISYANDKTGISLYTKASQTNFESSGLISYKNGAADSFQPAGNQDVSKVNQAYWNGAGVSDDWFKSLEFKGSVARNADGSINMEGFLELTDKAPKNAGAVLAAVASDNVPVTEDTDLPNPRTGVAVPFAAAAAGMAGIALAVCMIRRKRAR